MERSFGYSPEIMIHDIIEGSLEKSLDIVVVPFGPSVNRFNIIVKGIFLLSFLKYVLVAAIVFIVYCHLFLELLRLLLHLLVD